MVSAMLGGTVVVIRALGPAGSPCSRTVFCNEGRDPVFAEVDHVMAVIFNSARTMVLSIHVDIALHRCQQDTALSSRFFRPAASIQVQAQTRLRRFPHS